MPPLWRRACPGAPQLSSRHKVIVAAVTDPRVRELATGRADAAEVYDAAAAERALGERRVIAARLRMGVSRWSTRPPRVAPALADRYLAMKAGGKL